MIMLIKNLGPDYVVWDKAACISFKKPGRTTLYARFVIDGSEFDPIREELDRARHVDRTFSVDLIDGQGVVHASVEKVVYVKRKETPPGA